MELTVLGKSPSWQDRDGSCSAYLVREGDFLLMLDCGSGAFAKLRSVVDYTDVDALLISHLHADHVLDLVPFASSLRYSPRHPASSGAPLPTLNVPPGGVEFLARLGSLFSDEKLFDSAFTVREYDPHSSLELGPLHVRFCEVPHYVRTHAIDLTGPDGRRLTFGADCRPNDELPAFATGAAMLIVEATEERAADGFRGHMTAREAGELGRRAGVPRLLVTHYSDELDAAAVRSEAAAGFGADVELAVEGLRLTIG
jgi:ribonuclease BN (tRNA processing enzyme)